MVWINFPDQPDGLITGTERAKEDESLYQIQKTLAYSNPYLLLNLNATQSIKTYLEKVD